mmetsp:Transcript_90409/g.276886  ORF Transcript_90409/g.276886 Transcript_90409/m.276886 type:complete len:329 (+) Transcript_90409:1497-2483(+)
MPSRGFKANHVVLPGRVGLVKGENLAARIHQVPQALVPAHGREAHAAGQAVPAHAFAGRRLEDAVEERAGGQRAVADDRREVDPGQVRSQVTRGDHLFLLDVLQKVRHTPRLMVDEGAQRQRRVGRGHRELPLRHPAVLDPVQQRRRDLAAALHDVLGRALGLVQQLLRMHRSSQQPDVLEEARPERVVHRPVAVCVPGHRRVRLIQQKPHEFRVGGAPLGEDSRVKHVAVVLPGARDLAVDGRLFIQQQLHHVQMPSARREVDCAAGPLLGLARVRGAVHEARVHLAGRVPQNVGHAVDLANQSSLVYGSTGAFLAVPLEFGVQPLR